jgi:hypothetical protein
MRILGYSLLGFLVVCAGVIGWPYRYEALAQTDIANRSGCAVAISAMDRTEEMLVPGIIDSHLPEPVQARVDVFGCSRGRDGFVPASVTLMAGGKFYRGADCGAAAQGASLPCHVDFPARLPDRYTLQIQVEEDGAPYSVVVDVRRERSWRSLFLDNLMSV